MPLNILEMASIREPEQAVLMVDPSCFSVDYVINPHMQDDEGNPHVIDRGAAIAGHKALRDVYSELGYEVHVIEAQLDLPDMVFAANQSFPFTGADGEPSVILSSMAHPERRGEVELIESFYTELGYSLHRLADLVPGDSFEGMGDVLWWPGRRLLVAGHGYRTSASALIQVAEIVDAPLVSLELIDERFYHLDMALSFLDERTALWNPQAFSQASRLCLQELVPVLLQPPVAGDQIGFSCNAHAPKAGEVILAASLTTTAEWLRGMGYRVHSVDLGEFHKAGGSVFCLKMMLP